MRRSAPCANRNPTSTAASPSTRPCSARSIRRSSRRKPSSSRCAAASCRHPEHHARDPRRARCGEGGGRGVARPGRALLGHGRRDQPVRSRAQAA
jgi:hypothetical protein